MTDVLETGALAAALRERPAWAGDTAAISRSVEAPSFLDGIHLVDAIAQIAEELDHHPDIDIRWRTVTFTLSTHSAGGVTAKDLDLADRIEALAGHLAR